MNNELYLCVYVREFPAQALLRLRPQFQDKAVVVIDGEAPFQRVCSLNPHARKAGVLREMSRAELDSFPGLTLLKRSLSEEKAAHDALRECAGNFSPRIEDNSAGEAFLCILDISGTEKLFGPAEKLAISIEEAFSALGVCSSIAVSTNFHTAVCLARSADSCMKPVIVPKGCEREALASLPISALDISAEHAATFSLWGISSLRYLAMLPEKELIARLGQEGQRLRQLARGEYPHLFQPTQTALVLKEYIELDSPIESLESLLFGASVMIEQLITRVRSHLLSLATVIAEFGLEGGGLHIRKVRPVLATNDKHVWLKLMHLDWIAYPPQAPVVSMTLQAETGETNAVQLGLFSPQMPEPARLDVTTARIRAIVGEDRVGCPELKDTHEPDAFLVKEFSLAAAARDRPARPVRPISALRRLRPSERVMMTLRNYDPHHFYFRGACYEVEKGYGPWRVAGGWWAQNGWSLEEWDIVARVRDKSASNSTNKLLCCLITRNTFNDQWHVEAVYD